MEKGRIFLIIFFTICMLVALLMALMASFFTTLNEKYWRIIFKFAGYDIELKPSSPGAPQRVVRIWSLCFAALFFVLILTAVFSVTRH
jgi:hypothetical protein